MPLTLTGAEAVIRWGYHVAATVTSWSLTPSDGGLTLSASVASVDRYRLSQRPLVFVVSRGGVVLRWPIQELQISGASLSGTLGQKEPADVLSVSHT